MAFDLDGLVEEQVRLARLDPAPWSPPAGPLRIGGGFVAFRRGEAGPGRAGDRAWVGAVTWQEPGSIVATAAHAHEASAPYAPGLLAAREGAGLLAAVGVLAVPPDVVLVDATGRDHPRRAGLALHLGAALDRPTVGVTHRPLLAHGDEPGPAAGDHSPLLLDGEVVGAWLRTRPGARPVVVHAAWRTSPAAAVAVVRRALDGTRTPAPLREARRLARTHRAAVG